MKAGATKTLKAGITRQLISNCQLEGRTSILNLLQTSFGDFDLCGEIEWNERDGRARLKDDFSGFRVTLDVVFGEGQIQTVDAADNSTHDGQVGEVGSKARFFLKGEGD